MTETIETAFGVDLRHQRDQCVRLECLKQAVILRVDGKCPDVLTAAQSFYEFTQGLTQEDGGNAAVTHG